MKIRLFIALLLSALLLSSCASSITVNTDKNEQKDVTESLDKEIHDTTSSENNASPDYKEIYKDIITEYHEYVKSGIDNDTDVPEGMTGIAESMRNHDYPEEALGFSIKDINGDAIPELLFGETYVYQADTSSQILALYTLVDGEPQFVFESWSRYRFYITNDNKIYTEGFSGALFSSVELITLPQNSSKLEYVECYFTDIKEDDTENVYYFSNPTGEFDQSAEDTVEITSEEYQSFTELMGSKLISIDFFPFTYYESSLNNTDNVRVQYEKYTFCDTDDIEFFEAYTGEYSNSLILTAYENVTDLKIIKLNEGTITDNGTAVFDEEIIYSKEEFKKDDMLKITVSFGEILPHYAISYIDSNGSEFKKGIYDSMMDGSVYLAQLY
ncbi:MAG: hypothetical protein E7652_01470 [Ruminococcaceae bacterium]|nr:hypothetical protein [Oscillospiraceae bacterium]